MLSEKQISEECEKWFRKLNLMDQQGLAFTLEDLFKPSGSDVERAAEVFRHVGNRIREVKLQIEKAKELIKENRLCYSDVLLAVVFFTIDSDPINRVVRVLCAEVKSSNFNDKEKFFIAACVLTQSYIQGEDFSFIKWNITKMKIPTEYVTPFPPPNSFSTCAEVQPKFRHKSLSEVYRFFYKRPKFYSLWGSMERP